MGQAVAEQSQPLAELGLLALVLRDWIEGDIPIGYGKNKGYGSCTVSIEEWGNDRVQTKLISAVKNFRQGYSVISSEIKQEKETSHAL